MVGEVSASEEAGLFATGCQEEERAAGPDRQLAECLGQFQQARHTGCVVVRPIVDAVGLS
jgi:hypothetical protein